MAQFRITAPVKGVNQVVAGVRFVDSVGETDNARNLPYFGRHGYRIETLVSEPAQVAEPEPSTVASVGGDNNNNGGEQDKKPEPPENPKPAKSAKAGGAK